MHDLSCALGLRDRILLLLTLPALAAGCTSRTDDVKGEAKGEQAQAGVEAGVEAGTTAEIPEAGVAPLTGPGQTGSDSGETEGQEPAARSLPEGANFCFAPSEASSLADVASDDGECPETLASDKVRERVDSWSRRTGGPWNISVNFVASDTPEGGETRCCYAQTFSRVPGTRPSRGRPLVVDGPEGARVVVPTALGEPGAERGWLADARVELASVAAFARANLELLSVGAPARLILANLHAAREELEHTRLCLEQAGVPRLGAIEAVAPRPTTVVELAERTLLEACVPETLGALAAARAAAQARAGGRQVDGSIRDQIADDEAGHAAVAWATLRWAKSVDPVGVEARLRELEPLAFEVMRDLVEVEPALDERDTPQLWVQLIEPLCAG